MWFTSRLPPVQPSPRLARASYKVMGQRFWGLFCFLVFAFCLWVNANMFFPLGDTQVGSQRVPLDSRSWCIGQARLLPFTPVSP